MTDETSAGAGRKTASAGKGRGKGAQVAHDAPDGTPAPLLRDSDVPFPIMGRIGRKVASVPWALAEEHRTWIEKRLGMSLEAVARLGGMTAFEFACALDPERFKPGRKGNAHEAEDAVLEAIEDMPK